MNNLIIKTEKLTNMPWQDKPENYDRVIWRDTKNPIIKRNHTKSIDRIYNSSVIPYKDGYAGIFRADHKNNLPYIHVAFSKDGLNWDVDDNDIKWIDEDGNPYQPVYAYDPRLLLLEGEYYIIFCTDFGGSPSIGMGKTKDFKTFIRLENPTVPSNRNGVLFPRKINGKYIMLHRPSDNGHTPFGDIFMSESPDLVHWGKHRKVMSRGACGWWQGLKIGAGPVPIETSEGWVLFYHGVVKAYYEAAQIDGASTFAMFRKISLPLLTPMIIYQSIMGVIFGMQIFDIAIGLAQAGGSASMMGMGFNNSLATLVYYLYNVGFKEFNMGLASAIGWIIFFITALISVLILLLNKKAKMFSVD